MGPQFAFKQILIAEQDRRYGQICCSPSSVVM